MNLGKKAVESHILVLLIVSVLLTLLFTTVFSPLFANDHQNCQNIDYQILSKKKLDGGAKFEIKNTGPSKVNFQFDLEEDLTNTLMPDESKEFRVDSKESSIEIIPLYVDLQRNTYQCKGKKTTINTNTLI